MNNKITLFAIDGTGTEFETYVNIFTMCKNEFPVASYKIVTANKEYKNTNDIVVYNIDKLNYKDYQYFCIKNINKYIETDFAITMQSDGFIHNGKNWTDDFLNYDYIGEPWIDKEKGITPFPWVKSIEESVGCGGFSLRSKKFLSLCEDINDSYLSHLIYNLNVNEDIIISVILRNYFIQNNCKFSGPELAKQFCAGMTDFSYDRLSKTFGFHGREYIEKVLSKYKDHHGVDYTNNLNIYKKD
jgi:hypothetical protein